MLYCRIDGLSIASRGHFVKISPGSILEVKNRETRVRPGRRSRALVAAVVFLFASSSLFTIG